MNVSQHRRHQFIGRVKNIDPLVVCRLVGCAVKDELIAVGDEGARTFAANTLFITQVDGNPVDENTLDIRIVVVERPHANSLQGAEPIVDGVGNPIACYDWLPTEHVSFIETLWHKELPETKSN
jgi:hypothetical protein